MVRERNQSSASFSPSHAAAKFSKLKTSKLEIIGEPRDTRFR